MYPVSKMRNGRLSATYVSNISRISAPVTVSFSKKHGPTTPAAVTAHWTLIFGLDLSCSRITRGLALHQKAQLCLFTCPLTWYIASSLNATSRKMLGSRFLISTLILQTVVCGIPHSSLCRLVDLPGLRKNASCVAAMLARERPVRGRPLFPLQLFPTELVFNISPNNNWRPEKFSDTFGKKIVTTVLCKLEPQLVVHWLFLQFNPRPDGTGFGPCFPYRFGISRKSSGACLTNRGPIEPPSQAQLYGKKKHMLYQPPRQDNEFHSETSQGILLDRCGADYLPIVSLNHISHWEISVPLLETVSTIQLRTVIGRRATKQYHVTRGCGRTGHVHTSAGAVAAFLNAEYPRSWVGRGSQFHARRGLLTSPRWTFTFGAPWGVNRVFSGLIGAVDTDPAIPRDEPAQPGRRREAGETPNLKRREPLQTQRELRGVPYHPLGFFKVFIGVVTLQWGHSPPPLPTFVPITGAQNSKTASPRSGFGSGKGRGATLQEKKSNDLFSACGEVGAEMPFQPCHQSGVVGAAPSIEALRADEGKASAGMQGRGETGDPRQNPAISGIVRHVFHIRKPWWSLPAGNRTRFALGEEEGGEVQKACGCCRPGNPHQRTVTGAERVDQPPRRGGGGVTMPRTRRLMVEGGGVALALMRPALSIPSAHKHPLSPAHPDRLPIQRGICMSAGKRDVVQGICLQGGTKREKYPRSEPTHFCDKVRPSHRALSEPSSTSAASLRNGRTMMFVFLSLSLSLRLVGGHAISRIPIPFCSYPRNPWQASDRRMLPSPFGPSPKFCRSLGRKGCDEECEGWRGGRGRRRPSSRRSMTPLLTPLFPLPIYHPLASRQSPDNLRSLSTPVLILPSLPSLRRGDAVEGDVSGMDNLNCRRNNNFLVTVQAKKASRRLAIVRPRNPKDLPFPPSLNSGAAPYPLRFALIGPQYLDVKRRPNIPISLHYCWQHCLLEAPE
ncbi:hypothetical protein PR048_007966 [Dryococelus australis]|uniref:Uncharacterized protein n=1 Tax=Dryococelus australis TaxID=614101 RepID=A0ABQ9HVS4_9NEOP|nr:hypothetical protein PR048_007966 [Dryococelus australis]